MKTMFNSFVARLIGRSSEMATLASPSFALPSQDLPVPQQPFRRERKSRDETAYTVGQELAGVVSGIEHYGLFIRLPNGESGLVFHSEICWPGETIVPIVGEKVVVTVMAFKPGRGLALSLREPRVQATYEQFVSTYPVGSTVTGQIKSLVDYGVFITLAPGIAGLLHVSSIPNINVYSKESIGQDIAVKVMDIENATRRISLELA